jgi:hypothetical protein
MRLRKEIVLLASISAFQIPGVGGVKETHGRIPEGQNCESLCG